MLEVPILEVEVVRWHGLPSGIVEVERVRWQRPTLNVVFRTENDWRWHGQHSALITISTRRKLSVDPCNSNHIHQSIGATL